MLADLTILNIISFLLIFFIGLPHGSFDGAVAALVGFNKRIQFIQFLFYYIVLFLLVILFWFYCLYWGFKSQKQVQTPVSFYIFD